MQGFCYVFQMSIVWGGGATGFFSFEKVDVANNFKTSSDAMKIGRIFWPWCCIKKRRKNGDNGLKKWVQ